MPHLLVPHLVQVVHHQNAPLGKVVLVIPHAMTAIAFIVARAGTKPLHNVPNHVIQGVMMSVAWMRFALDTPLVTFLKQTFLLHLSTVVPPIQRPPCCAQIHVLLASTLIALMTSFAILTPPVASEIRFFVDQVGQMRPQVVSFLVQG